VIGILKDHKRIQQRGVIMFERYEVLTVGKYTITHYYDDDYWIEEDDGEGMQVFAHNFEKLIDDFYKEEF
jgi:hypothetical protein